MGSPGEQSFGRRLIPHVIDEIARGQPDRECFSIPRSANPRDGARAVTFYDYANAINHTAHVILEKCGSPPVDSIPTIAYIGPNDVRYVVFVIAAIKAGYKAFFLSPANSPSAQLSLLEQTDCWNICFPLSYKALVQPWLQSRRMNIVEADQPDSWFPSHRVPEIPYQKTFEEAQWLPFVVLHTSGSTGTPKPVVVNQGMLSVGDTYHNLADWDGRPLFFKAFSECDKIFFPLPLFHAAGIYMFMIRAIYWFAPIVLGVPGIPLTADLAVECCNNLGVDGTVLPPFVLEDISLNQDYIDSLAALKMVVFGGSSLTPTVGDKLAKRGVKLVNAISSTECTPYPTYIHNNPDAWQYFLFNSELLGADWRKVDDDSDAHHLVVVRKDKHPHVQSVFYNFPNDSEFFTKDLYKPHPSLKDYWMYCGRADDVVNLSSGKKFNPVETEAIIAKHSLLKGALVFGSNRFQPGLLIEPREAREDASKDSDLIHAIWPTVEIANKEAAHHATIEKGLIIVSSTQKPLPRAAKGNILRSSALKLYESEINDLYENNPVVYASTPTISIESAEALEKSVMALFQETTGGKISVPDTDFFSVGVDSIDIIRMSQQLRAGFEILGIPIDAGMIRPQDLYKFSTVGKFCQYLYPLLGNREVGAAPQEDVKRKMQELYEKYTVDIPVQTDRPAAADEGQTIILTGSTGELGSYLLDALFISPAVSRIICLNRREDGGREAQIDSAIERGLSYEFGEKVEFIQADLSSQMFGLPASTYNHLLLNTDRIIHAAWPVNFNISVDSLESHIQGVSNIARFASTAQKAVAVIFISTVGIADGWNASQGPVPETRLEDFSLPSTGYGQSKMIGSLVLETLAETNHFPAATIRVGQIAGPESEKGSWNKTIWLPTLIASSLYLGALPSDIGPASIDWVPVETVGRVILEIAGISQKVAPGELSGYYHCVNPATTSWESLAAGIVEFYGRERLARLVPFGEWIGMLEDSESETYQDSRVLARNPGVKLLDTYKKMAGGTAVVFETARTLGRSPALSSSRAITPDMMKKWCRQWDFRVRED
ncbi:hypothetical protein F4861DRAFT_329213 [Xylaria intraflava]|nr:hypothetical protein F4861DRAFT_329213 [Xylaria intraflava]